MFKQKHWLWILGGTVIFVTGLFVLGLGMSGFLPGQGGELYEDPQGRFTVEVDPAWKRVETGGPYTEFIVADPPIHMYLLVLQSGSIDSAFSQAFEAVGFDPVLLTGGARAIFGDWEAYSTEDAEGISHALAGQIVGENAYVLMVKADKPGISPENGAVMRVMNSLQIAGKEEIVVESYTDVEAVVREKVDGLAGSISVAVLHQDRIAYSYVYGEANPIEGTAADTQSIYRFGSMTKPVTASALMQLVEQGLVDLDAFAGEYIPDFPEHWEISVRQLLTHSACMPDSQRLTDELIVKPGESFAPLEEVFSNYVKDYPDLLCEPGKVSQYSNPHFLALARIIEEVSGEPYETYVVNHILTPLKMESTHFEIVEADERYAKGQFPTARTGELVAQLNEYRGPGQEAIVLQEGESFSTFDNFRILPPWGGLFGTPSDVTHFLQMHMNGGRYGETQILQPETVAAMQEMQLSTDGSPLGFGLSWWIGEDDFGKFYYHGGGGHTIETMMRFYPHLDLGVVVMCNVNGCQADRISAGLVSAWAQEN